MKINKELTESIPKEYTVIILKQHVTKPYLYALCRRDGYVGKFGLVSRNAGKTWEIGWKTPDAKQKDI